MLVMVVFFIVFIWIILSTPLIRLFLLMLILFFISTLIFFFFLLYFVSFTVNSCNGFFFHCIQMYTSVNSANQVVSVGADIAFDADPKFFACLVRFESSSVPTTLPTAYDVYPLDGRHDGGYYTV